MAKPFLRWAGSKQQLVGVMASHWTGEKVRYVEPFVGSARLFFALEPNTALLGDINSDLISMYEIVCTEPTRLCERLDQWVNSEEQYYAVRALDPDELLAVDRAARFIYLNRYCFNGLYRTNKAGRFNVPYGGLKSGTLPTVDELQAASKLITRATLKCGDFQNVLDEVTVEDFVYLDPPFMTSGTRVFNEYFSQSFSSGDLNRLRSGIEHVHEVGASFLLSYADCAEGKELARDFFTLKVKTRRNIAGFAGKRREANELLVTNVATQEYVIMAAKTENNVPRVTPEGSLVHLTIDQLQPSPHNPRQLFDPEPLAALRESIRQHGVLVPLTVYRLPGQQKYGIVDGERRFRCCSDLAKDGEPIRVPANVVNPPEPMASLLYMFNIHQFRQQWELMPTAIALKSIIDKLNTEDNEQLVELTGLSDRQVERCRVILTFPEKYRQMSMDPDPTNRIPSNFWVELYPVLQLAETLLPDLVEEEGRNGVIDRLVEKYEGKKIRSVIHFRRILEAYEVQNEAGEVREVADKLREYILDPELETRAAFDGFISDSRRAQRAVDAVDRFMSDIGRAKIEYETDRKDELIGRLSALLIMVQELLSRLEGEDPPEEGDV